MSQLKIHILYEYGPDLRPHGSAFIRLLRPLTYPTLRQHLIVTSGLKYEGQAVDAVLLDRLWRRDLSLTVAENLVKDVCCAGAKLIYALDDNFFDLPVQSKGWITKEHLSAVEFLLRQADGVMVTTQALRETLADFNRNIVVVPNALDERLLVRRSPPEPRSPFGPRRKVIGYMGTLTHDDDLLMVLPALQTVWERYSDEVEFQFVGGVGRAETEWALQALPVRMVSPKPEEIEYPLFMLWFSSRLRWDIAIAPLQDTAFTRCKSDIKFLDYSAIGSAGIYSRVPAYETSVRHLQTGWLAENDVDAWIEALETLLLDDVLRAHLAQNATRYLYEKRILARCANCWLKALETLLGKSWSID